ncbi:TIR domain-containing protein [Endothiovibrio diazotrophicus]
MSARRPPERFLVAFSFAGEQRELVRRIAEAVEAELGAPNVFLDEWFEHYIAGHDADLKLQEIYERRAVLAVVCVSAAYGEKPWTADEHEAIRARKMRARNATDESARLAILPIRVGDGEVEGIPFNAISHDAREKGVAGTARLIIDRLGLILPRPEAPAVSGWPSLPPALHWPVANHSEARDAFQRLIGGDAPWRLLPILGGSQTGKSHITRQMLGNGLRLPDLACGRMDFKGSTDLERELPSFVQHLGVPVPQGKRLNPALDAILDALCERRRPTLLIFDTYEQAGEAEEWVERRLLPSLIRSPWLRVVIAGQRVPETAGALWEAEASRPIPLETPPADDWFEFGRRHNPELAREFVEQACRLTNATSALLAQLLGPRT